MSDSLNCGKKARENLLNIPVYSLATFNGQRSGLRLEGINFADRHQRSPRFIVLFNPA